MQQLLAAQDIQARIISQGIGSAYLGGGSPSSLQVHPQDRWTALLLLSAVDDGSDNDLDEMFDPDLEES